MEEKSRQLLEGKNKSRATTLKVRRFDNTRVRNGECPQCVGSNGQQSSAGSTRLEVSSGSNAIHIDRFARAKVVPLTTRS